MNNEQAHEQARNALFGNIVMSTPKEKAISESDSHDSHEQNQSHSVEKISTQISTLTNATQRNQSQNLRKVYSHILLDDCITAKPIQWLIQGYLRKKGTAMLFGASGSAKSFIATDMSMHVAFKKFSSWNGKPIKHGAVIYFAGEDTEGLKMRIRGWMTEHGVTPNEGEFVIIDEPFSLDDENPEYDIENTIANIKAICPNPVLVVFDTLNRYMRGNENQSNEVRVFLQCVDRIVAEFDCSGMIVHHTGVNPDAKDRARGSSAFKGAVDIELKVSKSEKIITLEQPKNKDAEEEPKTTFTLKQIFIPNCYDEYGNQATTCIIEPYESQVIKALSEPAIKLNQYAKTAIKTFTEAIKRFGCRIRDEQTQHEFAAIELERWRKVSYELSTKDKDTTKLKEVNQGREKLCNDEIKILVKRIREGYEYYCFDLTNTPNADLTTKATITLALTEREKAQAAHADAQPKQNVPDAQLSLPIQPLPEQNEKSDAPNEPAHSEPPQP